MSSDDSTLFVPAMLRRDLRRALGVGLQSGGEDPVLGTVDRGGAEPRLATVRGDRLVLGIHRNGRLVRDRPHDLAVRVEELNERVGFGELGTAGLFDHRVRILNRGPVVRAARDSRIVCALQQEVIRLRAQLALRADVRRVHRPEHDDRERHRDGEQQPNAQAHGVRTV